MKLIFKLIAIVRHDNTFTVYFTIEALISTLLFFHERARLPSKWTKEIVLLARKVGYRHGSSQSVRLINYKKKKKANVCYS